MSIDKQLLKGTIPLVVLHVLAQSDLYGYQLIKAVVAASDGVFTFSEGTLYPVLHALERDGHLRAYWQDSDTGRKRKYYAVTPSGRTELAKRRREWRTFSGAIEAVLTEESQDA